MTPGRVEQMIFDPPAPVRAHTRALRHRPSLPANECASKPKAAGRCRRPLDLAWPCPSPRSEGAAGGAGRRPAGQGGGARGRQQRGQDSEGPPGSSSDPHRRRHRHRRSGRGATAAPRRASRRRSRSDPSAPLSGGPEQAPDGGWRLGENRLEAVAPSVLSKGPLAAGRRRSPQRRCAQPGNCYLTIAFA